MGAEARKTILIVEDNEVNRLVLTGLIGERAARIITAENGARGVDVFASEAVDFIFMDVDMPVMDGVAATRAIRACEAKEARKPAPIVAVTAHVDDATRAECKNAGMNDFIAKPVTAAIIEDALARWLKPADEN
ncbi:MAG: response regulator [Parvularculaceae bacterium]